MKQKTPKGPGPRLNCRTCNGKGANTCRLCQGKRTTTDWMHKVHKCTGCGGTGEQACVVCRGTGWRE